MGELNRRRRGIDFAVVTGGAKVTRMRRPLGVEAALRAIETSSAGAEGLRQVGPALEQACYEVRALAPSI